MKQPDVYQIIWDYCVRIIQENQEEVILATVAGTVAFVKMCKTGKVSRFWTAFFEMLMCGLIAGFMYPLISGAGFDTGTSRMIAVAIGWVGSDTIFGFIIGFLREKTGINLQHYTNYTADVTDDKTDAQDEQNLERERE